MTEQQTGAAEGVVDKKSAGLGVRQYHIGVAPGEVSTVALLPGDPFRVPLIAQFLTDVRDIAHRREHRTMTGNYKGKTITATSTGMGCPSTAIAPATRLLEQAQIIPARSPRSLETTNNAELSISMFRIPSPLSWLIHSGVSA
jgi:Phosphorylase superfamily